MQRYGRMIVKRFIQVLFHSIFNVNLSKIKHQGQIFISHT